MNVRLYSIVNWFCLVRVHGAALIVRGYRGARPQLGLPSGLFGTLPPIAGRSFGERFYPKSRTDGVWRLLQLADT